MCKKEWIEINNTMGFNQGAPLADKRAKLIAGQLHAVEGSQSKLPVNFFNAARAHIHQTTALIHW
jgi:hypothetical protein